MASMKRLLAWERRLLKERKRLDREKRRLDAKFRRLWAKRDALIEQTRAMNAITRKALEILHHKTGLAGVGGPKPIGPSLRIQLPVSYTINTTPKV